MRGKPLRLICVGRLKTPWWKEAARDYEKRIARMRPLSVCETRDGEGDPASRRLEEGKRLLAELRPGDYPAALDERGELMDTERFAALLRKIDEAASGRPCFIVGGPFGLPRPLLGRCRLVVSLSPLTWPHELARVLLLEQIYRAECIRRDIPYHH